MNRTPAEDSTALVSYRHLHGQHHRDAPRLSRPWNAEEPAGFFVNRRQSFRGRWIRYGGYYPKLYRRDAVIIDDLDLVDHFEVRGRTARLGYRLLVDVNISELTAGTDKAIQQPVSSRDPAESRAAK